VKTIQDRINYRDLYHRQAASPATPVPSNSQVDGSGTLGRGVAKAEPLSKNQNMIARTATNALKLFIGPPSYARFITCDATFAIAKVAASMKAPINLESVNASRTFLSCSLTTADCRKSSRMIGNREGNSIMGAKAY
jgi:hypothetical protein